jgi:MFS family permease
MISPLAADISYMVDTMSKEQPDLLGDRDAYAQAFALLSAALSAGVVGGPAIAGPMYGALGWKWTAICLGLASMSAAIPVVRQLRAFFSPCTTRETLGTDVR